MGGFTNRFHDMCNTCHVRVQLIKLGGGGGGLCFFVVLFLNEIQQGLTKTLLAVEMCRAPQDSTVIYVQMYRSLSEF